MNILAFLEFLMVLVIILFHPCINIKIEWKNKIGFNIFVLIWIILNIMILDKLGAFTILQESFKTISGIYSTYRLFLYSNLLIFVIIGCYYFKNYSFFLNQCFPIIKIVNLFETAQVYYLVNESNKMAGRSYNKSYLVYLLIVNAVLFNIEKFCYIEAKPKQRLKYDEEFKVRIAQKEEIITLINSYTGTEQMMLLISDKWGGGKTYFANQIIDQIKKNPLFYIINMNTSEMSSKEIFLGNMLGKISKKLKRDRFFLSMRDIDQYFEMIFQIVLGESVAGLIYKPINKLLGIKNQKILSLSEGTNRFSEILGKHKLLIVIDNLDSCPKETAGEVINLFNNILLFPKSIVLILGDYKQLVEKEIIKLDENHNYFMHIYTLNSISYIDLIKNMQSSFCRDIGDWKFKNIDKILFERIRVLKAGIEETKAFNDCNYINIEGHYVRDEALKEAEIILKVLEQGLGELEERLSNAKIIQKIYQEIYNKITNVRKLINEEKWNYSKGEEFLENVFVPACTFFSLINHLCPQNFVLENYELNNQNYYQKLLNTENNKEKIICAVIEYSFFKKNSNLDIVTYSIEEFKEYYLVNDLKAYIYNKLNM